MFFHLIKAFLDLILGRTKVKTQQILFDTDDVTRKEKQTIIIKYSCQLNKLFMSKSCFLKTTIKTRKSCDFKQLLPWVPGPQKGKYNCRKATVFPTLNYDIILRNKPRGKRQSWIKILHILRNLIWNLQFLFLPLGGSIEHQISQKKKIWH